MNECERYRQWMDDAVDGDFASDATELLEVHVASCAACRQHMDDILSLVSAAAELPGEIEPGRDLWPEIEGRLVVLPASRWSVRRVVFAVAALAIFGVGLSLLRIPDTRPLLAPSMGSEIVPAGNRAATLEGVRLEYGQARTELMEVVRARAGELSPETMEVIESNLALIDRAIDDIETVLADNPGEGRLDRHLYLAYARQIELLRWAARMPSQI